MINTGGRSKQSLQNELDDLKMISRLAGNLLAGFLVKDREEVEKIKRETDEKIEKLEIEIGSIEPKFPEGK